MTKKIWKKSNKTLKMIMPNMARKQANSPPPEKQSQNGGGGLKHIFYCILFILFVSFIFLHFRFFAKFVFFCFFFCVFFVVFFPLVLFFEIFDLEEIHASSLQQTPKKWLGVIGNVNWNFGHLWRLLTTFQLRLAMFSLFLSYFGHLYPFVATYEFFLPFLVIFGHFWPFLPFLALALPESHLIVTECGGPWLGVTGFGFVDTLAFALQQKSVYSSRGATNTGSPCTNTFLCVCFCDFRVF